jgi:hypothetical protein
VLKKQSLLTFTLTLAMSLSFTSGALALNYSGSQKNQATFETLEETRVSSPVVVTSLETNNGRTFKSHPVLDNYPKGTTYIYRSANLFGGRAAARLNTDILVFSEKSFSDKDAALAYLKDLGLIRIIDEAIGSVILVTPQIRKQASSPAIRKTITPCRRPYLLRKPRKARAGMRSPTPMPSTSAASATPM